MPEDVHDDRDYESHVVGLLILGVFSTMKFLEYSVEYDGSSDVLKSMTVATASHEPAADVDGSSCF
jgi:hypothetical protein